MINRTLADGEPIYVRIATELRTDIFNGLVNPGDMLPSEAMLANRFDASRVTIRKSLNELEQQGLVYSRPGKGYFIARPEHGQFRFDLSNEDQGLNSEISGVHVISPDKEVSSALALKPGKRVVKVTRLIKSQGVSLAFDIVYFPYDKGTPIVEAEINYAVFPDIASSKVAPFAFYTEMEIGSDYGDSEVTKALKCSQQEPLLILCRYLIGLDEIRIGYGKKYLRKGYGGLKGVSGYKFPV